MRVAQRWKMMRNGGLRYISGLMFITLLAFLTCIVIARSLQAEGTTAREFGTDTLAVVFEANLALISNVRYKMEYSYETTSEGQLNILRQLQKGKNATAQSPAEGEIGEIREVRVMTVIETYDNKSRIEMKRYDRESQHLKSHQLQVWNGELYKSYNALEESGYVTQDLPSMDGMRLENFGMCFAGTPFHEYIRKNRAFLDDNVLTISRGNYTTKVYLDPAQDYWPNLVEHFQMDQLRMRYSDIKVKKFPVEGGFVYFPVSGKIESFMPRLSETGELELTAEIVPVTIGTVSLVDIAFNVTDLDDQFDFEFPAGTYVTDLVVDSHYTVGATHEEVVEWEIDKSINELVGPVSETEGFPESRNDSQQQTGTSGSVGQLQTTGKVKWAVGGVFLFLVLAAVILVLLRQRRKEGGRR